MKKNHLVGLLVVIVLTLVSLTPLLVPELFRSLSSPYETRPLVIKLLALFIPVSVLVTCFRVRLPDVPRHRFRLFLLFLLLAAFQTELHREMVDKGHYFSPSDYSDNTDWQKMLHNSVLQKSPEVIPHSYRFLPDSLIGVIETITGDFEFSRNIYRFTFTFLLIFSIYYYASLYMKSNAALAVVLAYMLVYPISIRYYAGQPIDPMSHLSFVLAFIFLELDLDWFFVATIAIGVMAKESIALLAIYPLLFKGQRSRSWIYALVLPVIISAEMWLIRLWIIGGNLEYRSISSVEPTHIITNLTMIEYWFPQALLTIGVFFSFLFGVWRSAPYHPKRLIILLTPSLVITNIMFSWFHESRNFIPLVIPLAIITVLSFVTQSNGYEKVYDNNFTSDSGHTIRNS